jgi:stearoyl-CoA desaturase (delta-9 desaturase)
VSGFFYAHVGWFTNDVRHNKIEPTNPVVRDFSRFPELRVLDTHYWAPPVAWALAMFAIGGFQWLVWGFLLPTVTLAHATFCINTVNHLFGSRRFKTMDQSRNNVWTAIFAAGEGWHNNHHRYQRSARNGFYWWEFDPTYYVIRLMGWLGLAWDIQSVPERIYREAEAQHLPIAAPEPDLEVQVAADAFSEG